VSRWAQMAQARRGATSSTRSAHELLAGAIRHRNRDNTQICDTTHKGWKSLVAEYIKQHMLKQFFSPKMGHHVRMPKQPSTVCQSRIQASAVGWTKAGGICSEGAVAGELAEYTEAADVY
jgi:hypothetical protein